MKLSWLLAVILFATGATAVEPNYQCLYGPFVITVDNGSYFNVTRGGSICVPSPYKIHLGRLGGATHVYSDDGTVWMVLGSVGEVREFKNGVR